MSDYYSKITAPIAGDDPFGADVNYDLDYERLKNEMGKLGDIDTEIVESLSLKILTEKSKDVRVLAFLAYAALRGGGFGRLADVFCALAAYCQDDFERVFPRRDKAKAAALRWFAESRFSGQCEKVSAAAADVQDVTRLVDAISNLRTALDKKFPDGAPPLSLLHKRASEWKKTAENAINQAVSPADTAINANAAENINANRSVGPAPKAIGSDEYQEILQCIKKIETFIINLKETVV